MASEIVFLKDEKLRMLAQLIRNHEINNIQNLIFESIGQQFEYLRMCNSNQESVNTLLDECNATVSKCKDDEIRGPISVLILGYVENCLNNALQLIRNYTLRRTYLDKLIAHSLELIQALDELDVTSNPAEVDDFTEQIQQFNLKVMSHMKLSVNTHASQEFSRYLRNSGIGFDNLVRSHQARLGFTGPFKDLKDEQKLEVYGAIIEASGRLSVLDERGVKALSYGYGKGIKDFGEKGMFLIDVGMIIWDVYSSDHPIMTATREAMALAAKTGGATLGKIVGAAVGTKLVGVQATTLFVTALGIAGGVVGGFIFGAAAGLLFDLIFGAGGEVVLPTDGFIFYVAPMPNGKDLAKQIAHI